MKRQTKLVAVLSASALLALGASVSSMAATTGWTEVNGVWQYLDRDGDAVSEEWKKSGNSYFWLDENGEMATDTLVDDGEDKYFVDANGARVINDWRQVDNVDNWTNGDNDEEPETVWYYFGSTGKATTGKKTIQGKTYIFDETGEMFSKWHEHADKMYYLGEENEGFAYTGWHFLELREEIADDDSYDEDEGWFNFKASGEMRRAGVDQEIARAYIGGSYYGFDGNGVMVDGWVPPEEATASNAAYYNEDTGAQKKGWVLTSANTESGEDEDPVWFYLDSKGKPFNVGGMYAEGKASTGVAQLFAEGEEDGDPIDAVAAKVINSKTYLFDGTGEMLDGVYNFAADVDRVGGSGNLDPGYYYFEKEDGSTNGQMATGKTTVTYDGEDYYYNFDKSGKAYTNIVMDGTLYQKNGVRFESEESRMVYTIDADDFDADITVNKSDIVLQPGDEVVVSSVGKLKKSGTVTIDGTKYTLEDYKVVTPDAE